MKSESCHVGAKAGAGDRFGVLERLEDDEDTCSVLQYLIFEQKLQRPVLTLMGKISEILEKT